MIESDRVMETQKVEAQANAKFHDAMDEADNIANQNKKVDPSDKKEVAGGSS
jgi:hypothetical protein